MQLIIVSYAIIVITAIIVFGRWMDRYSLERLKVHNRRQTNYLRLQARLATGSGTIQKGGN